MRTSHNTPETISTIGIDVGKNTFHLRRFQAGARFCRLAGAHTEAGVDRGLHDPGQDRRSANGVEDASVAFP
jgi:hypothetical protein